MSVQLNISFAKSSSVAASLAIQLKLSGDLPASGLSEVDPQGVGARAAGIAKFSAKAMTVLDVIAPHGSDADRLTVIGLGKPDTLTVYDWLRAGGVAAANLKNAKKAVVFLDVPGLDVSAAQAADFALGMLLRSYAFDSYKTAKKDDDKPATVDVKIVMAGHAAAKKAFAATEAIASGVVLARDLVNLPPNVLGPVEFADKTKELKALGVEVEVLTENEMKKLGMGALLGVAQGSVRPPRLAVMHWNGGKAKVNAVGILGLVENMPDGNAQRPGDIVTSMSGQTIEIINTDAEGRLVLADALFYTKERFKPRFMVSLAT